MRLLLSINLKKYSLYDFLFILIVISFVIISVTYSLSTPAYEAPDEEAHHKMPYQIKSIIQQELESTPQQELESTPFELQIKAPPYLYWLIMAGIVPLVDEPHLNTIVNYDFPFGYKGRFLHGIDDVFPFSGFALEVHILRFFSTFFGVITLIFSYKISKIIFKQDNWLPLFSVGVISLVPTFVWINSVMNTDGLAWLFSTIAIYFTLKFLDEIKKSKFLILAAIFTGIATISKNNGYLLYPIIISALIYLVVYKQISIINFFKKLGLFLGISIISGASRYPYFIVEKVFQKHDYPIDLLPSSSSHGLNYIQEHLLNPIFIHNRLFEFSLSGMGQQVIWIPKIYLTIADFFLLFALAGVLFVLLKKKWSGFNISKNHLVIFLAPIIVLSIMFINWVSSEVGVARYTFPIISIWGAVFTIGFTIFVRSRKNLKKLLIIPLLYLGLLNIVNIMTIQEELAFGILDTERDGIFNDVDTNSFVYSNDFSDKRINPTNGTLIRTIPDDIAHSDPLKKEIIRQQKIGGWNPDFEYLLEHIPPQLFVNPSNRKEELRSAIDDLIEEGIFISYNDVWKVALTKVIVEKDEKGIKISNESDLDVLEVKACNGILEVPFDREIVFSCKNNAIDIISSTERQLPFNLKNGDLVQGESKTEVYLIQEGRKRHITTPSVFEELGYTVDMIKFVPNEIINKIPTGQAIIKITDL